MNDTVNVEDFLRQDEVEAPQVEGAAETDVDLESEENIEVQKAVVEELAADKAAQDVELQELRQKLSIFEGQVKAQQAMMSSRDLKIKTLETTIAELQAELAAEKLREIDQQERNPNALALLDRDIEIDDRFPGESRDQVLEVIKEGRDSAEREGRIRRAQVLEAVLVANEPNGTLAKRRAELEKLFADNGNIISGAVLEKLTEWGISHKNGEEYLLPSEIIKRTY